MQNAAQFGSATGAVLVTSNTILNGATFYSGGPINFANPTNIAGALTVPNAATLGAATFAVTHTSNTIMPGTTFYQDGSIVTGLTGSLPVQTDRG